ncbi:hypothetical protein K458DRAFT_395895 [Lentithecium fluviatile CBS 122367]|uniref:Uncharacterized protein n=1 Tax=Lentithecium fluviatile CBS 122367 TaxID=1168545 RepID=A0A6G1IGP1_9PLEO|nr:hypothetical protein K458DRAFT_395895 [Lentithecium fluviatile CBS 122367]
MSDYTVKEQPPVALVPPFCSNVLGRGADNGSTTPLLPATYRTKRHMVRLVSDDVRAFLDSDLDVDRLNDIHKWLWMAGLPSAPRPLHYQAMKKRDIVVAEKLDLHLVWSPARIFVKPVPRYLLSSEFWRAHICPYPQLYATAFGVLMTYVALIEREVDYNLAVNNGLLPKEVTWPAWLVFAEEVMLASERSKAYLDPSLTSHSSFEPSVSINRRFFYGELRVGRLNLIYRVVLWQPRGYFSGCTTYGAFVRDNVNSFIALFAYATIVLSAMQVGLATPWLGDDYAFGMASYVFSVFAIIAPLSVLAALFGVLGILFTVNLLRTLRIRAKRRIRGAGV